MIPFWLLFSIFIVPRQVRCRQYEAATNQHISLSCSHSDDHCVHHCRPSTSTQIHLQTQPSFPGSYVVWSTLRFETDWYARSIYATLYATGAFKWLRHRTSATTSLFTVWSLRRGRASPSQLTPITGFSCFPFPKCIPHSSLRTTPSIYCCRLQFSLQWIRNTIWSRDASKSSFLWWCG